LALPATARAEGESIVRVRSSLGALDERLAAELSTLGLAVQEVDAPEPDVSLEQIARSRGARAAVRVDERGGAIELWVESRRGAPSLHQRVFAKGRRGWNLAAVSALEILRADLLEVRDPPPPAPPVEVAPAVPDRRDAVDATPRASTPARLWAHVAAGAEFSPGGLGPSADAIAELRLELPWFEVGAFGSFAPVSDQVSAVEGVARTRHAMGGAFVDGRVHWGPATLSLGAGGVVAFFWMNGTALAPAYEGRAASMATAGPWLRGCAALAITPSMRVRLELSGGSTFPRAVIRFAGREVADWGQPFGLVTLGLELAVLP
jgi:hypothetical protein